MLPLSKVTIINFTVTMTGLEDQLLVDVVKNERPDLEAKKDELVKSCFLVTTCLLLPFPPASYFASAFAYRLFRFPVAPVAVVNTFASRNVEEKRNPSYTAEERDILGAVV